MSKTNLSLGVLLMSGLFLACSSTSNPPATGHAGSTGQAGAAGGSTGQAGAAGSTTDGAVTDGSSDGKCAAGAFKRDGVCACQPDVPNVCANVCVNVQISNDTCGDCNTKCGPTSVCSAGHCTVAPTTLVPAAAGCGVIHLTTAGTTIYFTDKGHGTVKSVPAAGGTPATIATGQMAPTFLQVVGTNIFWLNSGDNKIMKAPLPTGTPATTVTTGATAIHGFAVTPDGNTVYFSSGTKISKIPAAGGTAVVVGSEENLGVPGNIAVDGNVIAFATDINGDVDAITVTDGAVAKCGIVPDGGGEAVGIMCNRLGRSQGMLNFESIYAAGGKAYWAANQNFKSGLTSEAGNMGVASTIGDGTITAFGVSGDTAYLGEDGYIEKTPLASTSAVAPLAVARLTGAPGSIAVDSTKVYWSTAACTIDSAAK